MLHVAYTNLDKLGISKHIFKINKFKIITIRITVTVKNYPPDWTFCSTLSLRPVNKLFKLNFIMSAVEPTDDPYSRSLLPAIGLCRIRSPLSLVLDGAVADGRPGGDHIHPSIWAIWSPLSGVILIKQALSESIRSAVYGYGWKCVLQLALEAANGTNAKR